jgi:hypothetical protein
MRDLSARETTSLRGVLAFSLGCHVLDLITTQFRAPTLADEGNPFFMLGKHLGLAGWPWLVCTKVLLVGILTLAFWWYLGIRHHYLPDKVVRSPRSLIWYGMWDRKPYPKSLLARLFNARKLKFLVVVLAGVALPASGAAALFVSADNVLYGLGFAMPMKVASQLLTLTVLLVCAWWYWAYWRYYRETIRGGAVGPTS